MIEPKTRPTEEDLQALRESMKKDPDEAMKEARRFERQHGGLPEWYVSWVKETIGGAGAKQAT